MYCSVAEIMIITETSHDVLESQENVSVCLSLNREIAEPLTINFVTLELRSDNMTNSSATGNNISFGSE